MKASVVITWRHGIPCIEKDSCRELDSMPNGIVRRTSNNLVLAALLALLSYVPFEYLAKFSLLVAAGLFIVDPLPPYTRLLALGLVLFVLLLSRIEQNWQANQEGEEVVVVEEEELVVKEPRRKSSHDAQDIVPP